MKIHINSFVRRQTPDSGFTHWTHSDEALIKLIEDNLPCAKQGYKEGVLLVPVPPEGFVSGVVQLREGDMLAGTFQARRPGEEPRKAIYALNGTKIPAKSAYIVLYSHAVLTENNENETDADYEVISVNANPTEEEAPIATQALIANHFGLSGGTATNLSNDDFVELLRKSVLFWKDKTMACPADMQSAIYTVLSSSKLGKK